jgi:hypothetical protein
MAQSAANQSLDRNSLIYRENTGKYIDFGHNLGSAKPETAAAAEAFFRNSLQFVAGNYF